MSTVPQPDDLVHDEYLRAALRHAPDHGLTPPSSVTQNILAAAWQVHRPARRAAPAAPVRATRTGPSRWREALRFLGSPRWAGGFATGLVAALVVGLWIDNELASPVAPPPEASATARRDAAEPAPAVASPAPTRPAAAAPDAAPDTAPTAAVATPAPVRKQAAPTPDAAPTERPGASDAAMAAPAAAEPGVGAGNARTASTAALRREDATGESRVDAADRPTAGAQPLRTPIAKAEPAPAAEGTAPAAASPALTLLRRIRAESAAQTAQWTWQPPGATQPRPVDAEGEAWLLRLVQTARGRWVDVAVPSDTGSAAEVRWWRDGQPHARLRVEAGGLRWLETSGRIRFAPLEPPALERLLSF